jgi:uroporphyrinogen-III decarboxylase
MAGIQPGTKEWSALTWQQKREERFKVWLNPADVKFVDKEAEQVYKARVTRFIKAIKLEEPDRVPVMLPTGNFPAYWAGSSFHDLMYDYKKGGEIWKKYMKVFGDMDTFGGPSFIPSGPISEAFPSKTTKLPGLGLPKTARLNEFVEGEYMMADEYDVYMRDPTDYQLRVMLPRTSDFFAPFKNLPSMRGMAGAATFISMLAKPEMANIVKKLQAMTDEQDKYVAAQMEINAYIRAHGYPPLGGFGMMAGAPFDHFADTLRGTKGIVNDMFRQPKKLQEAMEWYLNLCMESSIKNFPMTNTPLCIMPLHKGDDMFMSDKAFAEFYWPTYRRMLLAMINEGLVPMPFAEGKYTSRLKQITDTPPTGVVWWFDQTDMKEAKRLLGKICCIVGNVPTSIMITGNAQQVTERCKQLIEDCAPGGGYILGGGASCDHGKLENFKAMQEAATKFGTYKKK